MAAHNSSDHASNRHTIAVRKFKRLSAAEQDEIVADRRAGMPTAEIATKYSVSQISINKLLRRRGEPATPRSQYRRGVKQSELPAARIIANHEAGWTLEANACEFGTSVLTIKRLLESHGCEMRLRRQYTVNHDFFQRPIVTEEQAYLAGFLGADGYTSGQGYSIKVSLQRQDKGHLFKIRDMLGSNAPVTDEEHRKPNGEMTPMATLIVCSKKLNADLCGIGIVPGKSLIAKPLYGLPEHLRRHHMRGWFDGDGTICRLSNSPTAWEVSIVGSYHTVEGFAKLAADLCGRNKRPQPQGNIWRVRYARIDERKAIIDALYGNATIYLDRKKALADEMMGQPRLREHRDWGGITKQQLVAAKKQHGTWKAALESLGIPKGSLGIFRNRGFISDPIKKLRNWKSLTKTELESSALACGDLWNGMKAIGIPEGSRNKIRKRFGMEW